MTTFTVRVDEKTRRKYNIKEKVLTFSELRRRIIGQAGMEALRQANLAAKKAGLDRMTLDEIDQEIAAARRG